jgi:peptidoglycan/xylan/chitin deacetylase (PgdA/CDA1 family)
LPGPDIGRREAPLLRSVRDAGFEVGVHTWDHIKWQDYVAGKNAAWTRREMTRATRRFQEIFACAPQTHGAAGWQMNAHAYALEAELGLSYASDCRGSHPFQPVNASGEPLGVVQLPTTLPTLDELIGLDGLTPQNVDRHLLQLTATPPAQGHVYTLHAELEGLRFLDTFERLLLGWRQQGYRLVSCAELFASLDPATLPRCPVSMGELPGRSGLLALQG